MSRSGLLKPGRHAEFGSCRHFLAITALLLAIPVCSGCGKRGDGEAISGTVQLNGQPLPNAALFFYPESGRTITVPVDAYGNYFVQLAPGTYKVTISVGAELPPGWKEGDSIPPPRVKIPPQYGQRVNTPLAATVVEGHRDPIDFEIK